MQSELTEAAVELEIRVLCERLDPVDLHFRCFSNAAAIGCRKNASLKTVRRWSKMVKNRAAEIIRLVSVLQLLAFVILSTYLNQRPPDPRQR
jgi:hypothetical protein